MKKQQQFTLFAALAALGLTGALVCAEAQAYGVKVVYPASTTSRIPVPTGSKREGTPPVKEDGELDVDTPIGQIELVLDSLSAIQATQLEVGAGASGAPRTAGPARRRQDERGPRRDRGVRKRDASGGRRAARVGRGSCRAGRRRPGARRAPFERRNDPACGRRVGGLDGAGQGRREVLAPGVGPYGGDPRQRAERGRAKSVRTA